MTANDYQNQDLFWVLRGGGGGSFGIVTQATIRAYPDSPAVVSTMTISGPRTIDSTFFDEGVARILNVLQKSNCENVPGQFDLRLSSVSIQATLTLYFFNTTETSAAESRPTGWTPSVFHNCSLAYTLQAYSRLR
jgi:hypothetical protein